MSKTTKKKILAIDPGPTESAYVFLMGDTPVVSGKIPNWAMLQELAKHSGNVDELAVEMIASYGMPVGREVFETCVWIGRFVQEGMRLGMPPARMVYRKDAKLHVCQSPRANDATMRQALIDRYGPSKSRAVGSKASPGPLYGMNVDTRAALAVGLTALETA